VSEDPSLMTQLQCDIDARAFDKEINFDRTPQIVVKKRRHFAARQDGTVTRIREPHRKDVERDGIWAISMGTAGVAIDLLVQHISIHLTGQKLVEL
jgi:hypothetical protein